MKTSFLKKCFPYLEEELLSEIEEFSTLKNYSEKDFVVKQGKIIRHLPIVLEGRIKVFSNEEEFRFLLYYINSGQSCVYSFAHILSQAPAEFSAIADKKSKLLLLPIDKVQKWLKKYPSLCNIVLTDYQRHYQDLLESTKQITCYNLDLRLLKYLRNKAEIENSNILKISHQELADDLGTSREVVSRLLKKLKENNHVEQVGRSIKML